MKEKIILYPAVLITCLLLFYGCGNSGGETNKPPEEKKLPLVRVRTVETSTFSDKFNIVGVIKPFATAKVSSEEGGLIVSLNKDKGSYVGRGEIIARIKKDVEIASYEQAEAQIELARINYEKQKALYEDNATTEMQYLTAKWQYEAAVRSQDILKQRLKTGFVRSPISGVVDEKYMNRGEMSAPGSPIVNIIDISRVKISAGVPESYITKIKKGQHVNITIEVIPGAGFDGTVSYISPSLDAISRTFEVEVVITNTGRILKPGMNANVEISQYERSDAVVVPQDLIIDNGDEQYVFVLEGENAKKRVIKIGGREGNNVLIESGLNPGDKLMYEGFQSVKDGEKVQVIQ